MRLILSLAAVCLICLVGNLASATDISCGSTYKARYKGETIRCRPASVPQPSPVPAPVPTPQPTPIPSPSPAPVIGKIVAPGESIQAAINASNAGSTVWVKAGKWVLNAQLKMKKGVSVKAYPGQEAYNWATNTVNPSHPYIVPGPCTYCGIRWERNQGNNEFSGFEVAGGHSGIDIHADNVTVRNNWIHDTNYTSILIASSSTVLVEHNKTERDGLKCIGWLNNVDGTQNSPRHCHSVYLSNVIGYCGMSNNKILENDFSDSGGAGVNFNGDNCKKAGQPGITNTLIKGNRFKNVNTCSALWHGTSGTRFENNSCTILSPYIPPGSTLDFPVGMKCGVVSWTEKPVITGDIYNLKSGYTKYCQY